MKNVIQNLKPYEGKIFIPERKWEFNWGIDPVNAKVVYALGIELNPSVIVETGTFEGQGTYVLSNIANKSYNSPKIYTIDYDGDPTTVLEKNRWENLKNIRNTNLENIKTDFPNVTVKYIEGDSRTMIPSIFNAHGEKHWDLFYQDSMHFYDGIMTEWNLMYPYSRVGSVVIFDDSKLNGVKEFIKWFKTTQTDWEYVNFQEGHGQFIAQRIK